MRTKLYDKNIIRYIKFNKNAENKQYSGMFNNKKITFIKEGIINEDGCVLVLPNQDSTELTENDHIFLMAYENDKVKDGCRLFKNLGVCAESDGFLVYKISEIGRGYYNDDLV